MTRCDDLDALATWAEAEGGLLDEVVWLAVEPCAGGWRLVLATPLPGETPDDPREAFAVAEVPARRWHLTPIGCPAAPVAELPAEVGGLWPTGAGAGLALDLGAGVVEVPADGWEAEVDGDISLPVRRVADPLELTFHGPGPVTSGALAAALASRGHAVALHHNWAGSGQRFGSAHVRDVQGPAAVVGDEPLGGAWRVTPAGVPAEDRGGVWLTGQSLAGAAYVTLHRTEGSEPALVAALAATLYDTPGLSWAHAGDALVPRDALQGWLDAL